MKVLTLIGATLTLCAFGASAEVKIDLDTKAKPIKDMRSTANGIAMGVNGANEAWLSHISGNDDILFI